MAEASLDPRSDDDWPGLVPAGSPSSFRAVSWRWYDVLIGVAPLLLARLAQVLAGPERLSAMLGPVALPLNVFNGCWLVGYSLWIARKRLGSLPSPPRPRAAALEGLIALGIFPAIPATLIVTVTILFLLLGPKALPNKSLEPVLRAAGPNALPVLVVMIVLLAPIGEEMLFRGILYNLLRRRWPIVPAALVQALAFGFLHPFGLVQAVFISGLGFVFALVYEWRKTLLAPMLLHSLQNSLATVALFWILSATANGPMLGVRFAPKDDGCLVTEVAAGTGAEAAGLRAGDLLTAVEGIPVGKALDISPLIAMKHAGDRVRITFRRGAELRDVDVVLKARSP